jgi:hypothetical protein
MAPPDDGRVPIEFSANSTKRRAPKKLQDVGIAQFRRQGVAHHVHANSAAATLNKQKADQRTETWLGRGLSKTPADAPRDKAKGKKKAKSVTKGKRDAASPTVKNGGLSATGTANEDVQMGHNQTASEHVKTHKRGQEPVVPTPAPTRKVIKTVTVNRHIKPTQGLWGHRAVENAKKTAPKLGATAYPTTPTTMSMSDGDMIAAVKPTPKPPTPKTIIPSPAMKSNNPSPKPALNSSGRKRAAKKSPPPMFSDDETVDQDETSGLFVSSKSASPTRKTPQIRTVWLPQANLNTNPIIRSVTTPQADNNTDPYRRDSRAPSTPQKRQVRFASSASAGEGDEMSDEVVPQQQQKKRSAWKQSSRGNPAKGTTTANTSSHARSHSPSLMQENLDPGELSDDEDSELHAQVATAKATSRPKPSSTPAASKPEDLPTRRKGVAGPPMPKRARATPAIDNDDHSSDAAPLSKKAKTDIDSSPSTKKKDLPARKKGVASKPVRKKKKPVYKDESFESDG